MFNYSQICSTLLKGLPERQKTVLVRRFNLRPPYAEVRGETLEFIGKDYGITRERVRQIEKDSFQRLKPEIKSYQKVFQYFRKYFKENGGLKKEDILFEELGGRKYKNQINFLLTLGEPFERLPESDILHSLWTVNRNSLTEAKKAIDIFYNELKKAGRPLSLKQLKKYQTPNLNALNSYLEISKTIQKNSEGLFGLKEWPEINPRGVKDKAYLVFKKEKKPLHFSQLSKMIGGNTLSQTVHNELIKDPRFVLVGRGIYALKEWGYKEGVLKDVISAFLKEAKKPLSKEEILKEVLKQRLVKENTVLLNLSNKKYFLRDSKGLYKIREI